MWKVDFTKGMAMTAENALASVGRNIQEKATVIWNVANSLFGAYKPHEYGLVILPMTVIKRFHDCLLPTHAQVLEQYEKIKHLAVKDGVLRRASGYAFYNTSKFTFETVLSTDRNLELLRRAKEAGCFLWTTEAATEPGR